MPDAVIKTFAVTFFLHIPHVETEGEKGTDECDIEDAETPECKHCYVREDDGERDELVRKYVRYLMRVMKCRAENDEFLMKRGDTPQVETHRRKERCEIKNIAPNGETKQGFHVRH